MSARWARRRRSQVELPDRVSLTRRRDRLPPLLDAAPSGRSQDPEVQHPLRSAFAANTTSVTTGPEKPALPWPAAPPNRVEVPPPDRAALRGTRAGRTRQSTRPTTRSPQN